MPAFSQAKFQRYPDEAKIIFTQDFEPKDQTITADSAWRAWCGTPVDTISELYYYAKSGSRSVSSTDIYSGSDDWKIIGTRTDSVIVLYNAVESSTSSTDLAKSPFPYAGDVYKIEVDDDPTSDHTRTLADFGEDGGKYYFKYSAGDAHNASGYDATNHNVDKYRRNMYIRGLEVDDYSSYRLTLFLKVKPDSKATERTPLFNADLMRGYHHQRAPFSMGYKSGKAFTYSQESFSGDWEKVTLMSYYINDSVAEAYTYYGEGFVWADDWTWNYNGKEYNYIMQPDKYFIRLAFRTDSVDYSVDNIALTKSMIGGCEYYEDILRVNFGYETNLKDIVEKRMAIDNIPAVEIPNQNNQYIEVWYLDQDGDPDNVSDWKPMPIRCAEYHQDGYMYLFTQSYPNPLNPSETITLKFGDKKQVLVTFHNSTDNPDYVLKYTGDFYPNPQDTAWVNAGKIVPSFYNEIAVPNPNIVKGVSSIDGLPPIMTKAPYEEGSFGLPLETKQLKFQFSKKVKVDEEFNGQNTQSTTGVIAYFDDEVWKPTWDEDNSCLVITRPEGFSSSLQGDHTIHLVHIKGVGGNEGNEVLMHYHFGEFDPKPAEATVITYSDWRSTLTDQDNAAGCVAVNTWSHSYDSSKEQFERGEGQEAASTKCRLYLLANDGLDNCGYYVSPRNKSGNTKTKYSGNLYALVNIAQAGEYVFKFKCAEWWNAADKPNSDVETHLYFYPKPDGLASGFTFETFSGVTNKTDLGEFKANTNVLKEDVKDVKTGKWPAGVETLEYKITVSTPGEYIFEWCIFFPTTISSSSNGMLIGNYSIVTPAASEDLSTPYVKKLLSAVEAAKKTLASISVDKYKGPDYNALSKATAEGDVYVGNFPSKYDSVVAYINTSLAAMSDRVDLVDKFHSTEETVATLLASFVGDSAKYQGLQTYKDLNKHKNDNAGWIDSVKTTAQITAEINAYNDEMKALNDRMALIATHNSEIADTKTLIDAKDARKDYEEYDNLVAAQETAIGFNVVDCANKDITDATDALIAVRREYIFRYDYEIAKTRQIKELCALADSLGYDFGNKKDSIKTLINALGDDETALNNVLREAAILQILKIYKENNPAKVDKLEGYDVSALIPNYFLYNEAKVDRDMDLNSNNVWRISKNTENTTAFPGWTVFSTGTLYPGQTALDWPVEGHVFIGGLRYTGTSGHVESIISSLPQAYYQVGFDMGATTISSSSKSTCTYKAISGTDTVTVAGTKNGNPHKVYLDSVRVKDNNTMIINYTVDSKNTSDNIIMNSVMLKLTAPDDKADYEALVAAQETKLAGLITFVGTPTQDASVEYYNLGGMKINNPKSGEIIIRKTIQNGKVVVDKVLVK